MDRNEIHMTHVTKEFHWVRPKQFLILGYIWHKPCTYLVSRLALSANRLNQASTWDSSPRSSMMCVQNDFLSLWFVRPKPCTYRAPSLILSPNGSKRDSTLSTSPSSFIWYVWHNPYQYLAVTLTLSPSRPKWDSTWPTSPRSSIGCVQNNFWSWGTFGANCTSILCQD
jgi:hypothetical protein